MPRTCWGWHLPETPGRPEPVPHAPGARSALPRSIRRQLRPQTAPTPRSLRFLTLSAARNHIRLHDGGQRCRCVALLSARHCARSQAPAQAHTHITHTQHTHTQRTEHTEHAEHAEHIEHTKHTQNTYTQATHTQTKQTKTKQKAPRRGLRWRNPKQETRKTGNPGLGSPTRTKPQTINLVDEDHREVERGRGHP